MTVKINTIPSKEVARGKKIGDGGFGAVYRGKWHGFPVAIKALKIKSKAMETDLRREASVMAKLDHPAIVRLYGICLDPENSAMILEFLPRGDLADLLKDQKQALPWNPLRWRLAIDIGAGLAYLHANKVLHRDLKSRNILLDRDLRAKICDFGLAKVKNHLIDPYTYSQSGTVPWMAPELFSKTQKKTRATDVYAFGMILWEIASRKSPYSEYQNSQIIAFILQGEREQIPKECPVKFKETIKECWIQNPRKRVTASEVLKLLEDAAPKFLDSNVSIESVSSTNQSVEKMSSFQSMSEVLKKSISVKSGFTFGSEEFRQISSKYATSYNKGLPSQLWNLESGKTVKTFGGHGDTVLALAPARKNHVASGSYDRVIKIWNLNTGKCTKTLKGHTYGVYALVRLLDGMLASGSQDNTICIWDEKKEAPVNILKGHDDWIRCLAAMPNHMLASGSSDQKIKIWDSESGKCVATLLGHTSDVCALAYLWDDLIASGSYDQTVKIWDVKEGKCVQTLKGHTDAVYALARLPKEQLASASYDQTIKVWDLKSGKCLKTLTGHTDLIVALALLENGQLASGSVDTTIKIWDLDKSDCTKTLKGNRSPIYTLLPQVGYLLSGSEDGKIKLWDVEKGVCVKTVKTDPPKKPNTSEWQCLKTLRGHIRSVTQLRQLSNGALASASSDGMIKIWDVSSGKYTQTIGGHKGTIYAFIELKSGHLVTGSSDNTIKIWETSKGTCVKTLEGHAKWIEALVELENGQVASGSADGTIKIWGQQSSTEGLSFKDWVCLKTLKGHQGQVAGLVQLKSGLLASAGRDNKIKLWDIDKEECVGTLEGHKWWVNCLVELQSGYLASGSRDGEIKIWDTSNGTCLKTLNGHQLGVYGLTELRFGYLVSGSQDKTIKIWDIDTGKCLRTLTGHESSVYTFLELTSGELVSGSSDKSIKIWGEHPHKLSILKTFQAFPKGENKGLSVTSVGLLPNQQFFTYSSQDSGKVRFWDMQELKCVKEPTFPKMSNPKSWSQCLALPGGKICFYGGGIRPVVLDYSGEVTTALRLTKSFVSEVAYLSNERLLLGRRSDMDLYSAKKSGNWNELMVWDLNDREDKRVAHVSSKTTEGTPYWDNGEICHQNSDGPLISSITPYGNDLVAVSLSNCGMRVFDAKKNFALVKAFGIGHFAQSVCPINKRIIATYGDLPRNTDLGLKSKPTIKIWDMQNFTCIAEIPVNRPKTRGKHLAMLRDQYLVFGNGSEILMIDTKDNYKVVQRLNTGRSNFDAITNLEALTDGRLLVSFFKGDVSILGSKSDTQTHVNI